MINIKKKVIATVLVASAVSLSCDVMQWQSKYRRILDLSRGVTALDSSQTATVVQNYTIDNIISTVSNIRTSHPQLLVWDGKSFCMYNLVFEKRGQEHNLNEPRHSTYRNNQIIPLLVNALRTNFPDRFQTGTPPFQILWSADDYIGGNCINEDADCPSSTFAPVLVLGSTPKNKKLLPAVKAFPNPYFTQCLYDWRFNGAKECKWKPVNEDIPFEELERKIFWRGSDFPNFLNDHKPKGRKELVPVPYLLHSAVAGDMDKDGIIQRLCDHFPHITPRWIAVTLTLKAKQHRSSPNDQWIDALFSNRGAFNKNFHRGLDNRGLKVATDPVDPYEMSSKYAYQIDLGGGMC